MYHRHGTGIPKQNNGGEDEAGQKALIKIDVQSLNSIGEKSFEDPVRQEADHAGPFVVNMEQADPSVRDENNQMTNKINS